MKKLHVLIVDDDLGATTAFVHVLKKKNIETSVVREGTEAIDEALKKKFDLILLDIRLPLSDVDGWEVLMRVKSDKKRVKFPYMCSVTQGLSMKLNGVLSSARMSIGSKRIYPFMRLRRKSHPRLEEHKNNLCFPHKKKPR